MSELRASGAGPLADSPRSRPGSPWRPCQASACWRPWWAQNRRTPVTGEHDAYICLGATAVAQVRGSERLLRGHSCGHVASLACRPARRVSAGRSSLLIALTVYHNTGRAFTFPTRHVAVATHRSRTGSPSGGCRATERASRSRRVVPGRSQCPAAWLSTGQSPWPASLRSGAAAAPGARGDTGDYLPSARPAARAAARPADGYTARHLTVLEGLEAVRKRPGMYIGSTDGRGLMHCLWEIIDNAVDEALAGHCTAIEVVLHPTGPPRSATTAGASRWTWSQDRAHRRGAGDDPAARGRQVRRRVLHRLGRPARRRRLRGERPGRPSGREVERDGHEWAASFRRGVPREFSGAPVRARVQPGSPGCGKVRRVPRRLTGTRIRFWPDPPGLRTPTAPVDLTKPARRDGAPAGSPA